MRLAQKGDQEAFSGLFGRFQGRLMGFLGPYCRWDRALAEELIQSALVRAYEKRGSWNVGRPLAPWLFRIARNEAVDAWRRARKIEPGVLRPESLVQGAGQAEDAENEQELRRLLGALDELPDKQRETVNLVRQGFSHAEIAEIQDAREDAVRQNLSRAIRTLRVLLRVKE